jgi:solute carrier family 31 (copper transporter), member 1
MGWVPANQGQYAGTCIFLIALAAIFRALIAARLHVYPYLMVPKRNNAAAYGQEGLLVEAAGEKNLPARPRRSVPWRAKDAVIIASLDVVVAGVGYLL